MKPQIWIIGGGDTYPNEQKYLQSLESWDIHRQQKWDWKKWLVDGLADNYDCQKISMPDKSNANYSAWKIIFQKYLDEIDTNVPTHFIGHSLGGIFLAKFLSENKLPLQLASLHLVAPVWSYPKSELKNTGTFSFEVENLSKIPPQTKAIHIWASRDDEIVDFEDSEKYHEALHQSTLHAFTNRGHFLQSHFYELFGTFL